MVDGESKHAADAAGMQGCCSCSPGTAPVMNYLGNTNSPAQTVSCKDTSQLPDDFFSYYYTNITLALCKTTIFFISVFNKYCIPEIVDIPARTDMIKCNVLDQDFSPEGQLLFREGKCSLVIL